MTYQDEIPLPPPTLKGRKSRKFWRYFAPELHRNYRLTPATEPLFILFCTKMAKFSDDPESIDLAEWEKLRRIVRPLGIVI